MNTNILGDFQIGIGLPLKFQINEGFYWLKLEKFLVQEANSWSVKDTPTKNCELFYSRQEFPDTEAASDLFFICLHNQLSSMHSIDTYQRVQVLEKGDSYIDSNKWLLLSLSFTAEPELVFVLPQENAFLLQDSKIRTSWKSWESWTKFSKFKW